MRRYATPAPTQIQLKIQTFRLASQKQTFLFEPKQKDRFEHYMINVSSRLFGLNKASLRVNPRMWMVNRDDERSWRQTEVRFRSFRLLKREGSVLFAFLQ